MVKWGRGGREDSERDLAAGLLFLSSLEQLFLDFPGKPQEQGGFDLEKPTMKDLEPFVERGAGNALLVGVGSLDQFLNVLLDLIEFLKDINIHRRVGRLKEGFHVLAKIQARFNRVGFLNP